MPRKVMAVVVVGMFLFMIGCGGGKKSVTREKGGETEETSAQETAVQEPPSKGGTAKDTTARNPVGGSHGDRTYIDPSARLSNYKAVLMEPPKMDTARSGLSPLPLKEALRSRNRPLRLRSFAFCAGPPQ